MVTMMNRLQNYNTPLKIKVLGILALCTYIFLLLYVKPTPIPVDLWVESLAP